MNAFLERLLAMEDIQEDWVLPGQRRQLYSVSQAKALSISTRIAASISCLCAILMLYQATLNRHRMYHRLMLGLSLHLLVSSIWFMVGSAAVPEDDETTWGAHGTIQTCTAQGFFLQIALAVPLYYCSLSLYSYVAVKCDFDVSKYGWMEKWIHIGVHLFPVGSAIWLLAVDAFNPTGAYLCWIASVPLECGDDNGVECERGPQNIDLLAWIFAGLPSFFFYLFPTAVMIALYVHVRRRQRMTRASGTATLWNPRRVAYQAFWYLLGIYWTYIFAMVSNGLKWFGDRQVFALELLSLVVVLFI